MLILPNQSTKTRGNIFVFNGWETCTSCYACVLAWVQPFDFQRIFKDSNRIIKKNQCENNNHFERYPSNGPSIKGDSTGKRNIDFSVK